MRAWWGAPCRALLRDRRPPWASRGGGPDQEGQGPPANQRRGGGHRRAPERRGFGEAGGEMPSDLLERPDSATL